MAWLRVQRRMGWEKGGESVWDGEIPIGIGVWDGFERLAFGMVRILWERGVGLRRSLWDKGVPRAFGGFDFGEREIPIQKRGGKRGW